jgi:hypothetical protein
MGWGCFPVSTELLICNWTSNIAFSVLIGNQETDRPHWRHRRRWKGNIKINLTEWEGVCWIHLAQDRDKWRDIANTLINLQVP